MKDGKLVDDHKHYSCVLSSNGEVLLLAWKKHEQLNVQDFRDVVADFAGQCKTHKPARAVIDARGVDPDTAALGWVSGRKKVAGEEEYMAWWAREVIPVYNDSGISSLAVATGNPNAPGETPAPPVAKFKTGYFNDVESALSWK
jgi:hypothetical protein